MAKEDKKKQLVKRYFDVKVEVLVPAVLTYRVYAEDENDALKQITKQSPTGMKPNLSLKRMIKATIYDAGCSVVRMVKMLGGK